MPYETKLDAFEDMRTRFGDDEERRQFTPRLRMREARAFIWLAMTADISLTDMFALLVREEIVRRGLDVDGPEFGPPIVARTKVLAD